MHIVTTFEGKDRVFETTQQQVVIGRPKEGTQVDLDLTPDESVSRPHARIWMEEGQVWIKDLHSRYGTHINGTQVNGDGKTRLCPSDRVLVGNTTLRVEEVTHESPPCARLGSVGEAQTTRRLLVLCELSSQFIAEPCLETLLQLIVHRVVTVIDGAERGALLLGEDLRLKAHYPASNRPSINLARKAMQTQKAFIWQSPHASKGSQGTQAIPTILFPVSSAMYAPMSWKGKPLGVICVDNPKTSAAFGDGDLRFLEAIAHKAALAVASHRLQQELQTTSTLLQRLLTNFSPRVRDALLEQARLGRLRLGGKRSEVTVLCSDIRGFTQISACLEVDEVTEMLNAYFSELVDVIFRCDGTVDKFMGDAILAVFGSPLSDSRHHEKAVRAALEMQSAMAKLNAARQKRRAVCCEIGIGIHSGEVMHGFIGSENRMEFTVIGEAVNQASRFCDGASGGEVLISHELYEHVWNVIDAEARTIDGKHGAKFPAYRVDALRGSE